MQITKISAYSLKGVLSQVNKGFDVAGYTVKPGFSNGLFLYANNQRGKYVGF